MGEVYRVTDTRLHRDVAVKVSAEHFSERFEREARAVAALNHPNICTLYDLGPNYLVMELVEGHTLAERIKESAIPIRPPSSETALKPKNQLRGTAIQYLDSNGWNEFDLSRTPSGLGANPGSELPVQDHRAVRLSASLGGDTGGIQNSARISPTPCADAPSSIPAPNPARLRNCPYNSPRSSMRLARCS